MALTYEQLIKEADEIMSDYGVSHTDFSRMMSFSVQNRTICVLDFNMSEEKPPVASKTNLINDWVGEEPYTHYYTLKKLN